MSDKVYTRHWSPEYSVLDIAKWLRAHGTLNVDFVFVRLNYSDISVKFNNDALELSYIMKFDWTKND